MSVKRYSMVVTGRVQGVGFRFFTSNHARKHHCTGWVRNCGDGNVALEVQGEEEALKEFQKEINIGPILSKVRELKVTEIPVLPDERNFIVRH